MFDYLYEWVQNLAFYLVLVTAVIHMIPESGYKKYIRFFTGLVLVLMVTTPFLKLFGMDTHIRDVFQTSGYEKDLERIMEAGEKLYMEEDTEEDNEIEVEEIQIVPEE